MLFGKKKGRDKVPRCPNGHLLDPSWDHCPYCEEASNASGEYLADSDDRAAGSRRREPAPPPSAPPGPPYGAPPPTGPQYPPSSSPYGASPPASPYGSPARPYGQPPPTAEPPRRPAPEPVRRLDPEPVRKPVPEPLRRDAAVPGRGVGSGTPAGPAGPADDITVLNVRSPAPAAPPSAQPYTPPPAAAPSSEAQPYAASPVAQPYPPPAMPPLSAPPGSFAPESAHGPDATQILASPVGEKSVVAWVVVASGSLRGRDFRLPGGTARLGSAADCEVRIADDPYISSHHAELVFGGGQYVLRDLQSTNGSFVNDSRVAEQQLRDGDRVRLGQTKLVFKSFNL